MRKLMLAALVSVSALAATPVMADTYGSDYGRSYGVDRDRDGRSDRNEDRAYDQRFDRDRDGRPDRFEDRAYDQRFDRDRDGRPDRLEDRAFDQRFGNGPGFGGPNIPPQGPFPGFGYSPREWNGWYPGWRNAWYENREILPPYRLIRRIERQGYCRVRTFGFSGRGAIRAVAFDTWNRPVQLRVDPYTGMILRVWPA